jgi:general secretion pathway protein D
MNETQTSGLDALSFAYDGVTRSFTDIAFGTAGGISISEGIISLDNKDEFSLTTAIVPTNSDGDTKVLSAPRIIVSHNEEGVINVSESRPIITSSTSFSNSDNNTRSNVEYRDIGIQLKVTPLIGADGTVQMVVEQTIEDVIREVTIDGNPQPVIGKREATSTVSVKDGQIVILGGLQENSLSGSDSYFPIVGKLPVIRSLFGVSSDEYKKTEIIIFIRPKVLANPAEADALARNYVKEALETNALTKYIKTNSTGNTYLEHSVLDEKINDRKASGTEDVTAETPSKSKQRSTNRVGSTGR